MDGDKNFNKAIASDPKFDEVYGPKNSGKKRFSLNDPPPNKNVQKKKKKTGY